MNEMTISEIVGLTIVSIGVLFDIFGCIGLVRLPDVYNRLQSATKCVTVGTCFILAGSLIVLGSVSGAIKGVICIAFILITSPTAAHALARAAHRSGVALCEESVVDQYEAQGQARSDEGQLP
ncbi:MAG: monovalent cation/H(+) antiporter subunit G [Gammaproteobacteria bacterium]